MILKVMRMIFYFIFFILLQHFHRRIYHLNGMGVENQGPYFFKDLVDYFCFICHVGNSNYTSLPQVLGINFRDRHIEFVFDPVNQALNDKTL